MTAYVFIPGPLDCHMKCGQIEETRGRTNVKGTAFIIVAILIVATIAVLLMAREDNSSAASMSPSGPQQEQLDQSTNGTSRLNQSEGGILSKQEVLRIVKAWVEGNAEQEEAREAIRRWRAQVSQDRGS